MSVTINVSENDMHNLYILYLNRFNKLPSTDRECMDKFDSIHDDLNAHIAHYVVEACADIAIVAGTKTVLKRYDFSPYFVDYLHSIDIEKYDPANSEGV